MSVYKPQKSPFWQYDFQWKGRRFHGSTGQRTRRDAEAIERKLRRDAAEGRLGEASALTLDEAAGKWWIEVGRRNAGSRDDIERRLEQLLDLVGKDVRLAEITTAKVSTAIEKRRGRTYRKSPAAGAREYLPSNATVNRDVIGTLRPILNRARVHWGAEGLPAIAWADLKLKEPRETVRVYSPAEQDAWRAQCAPTPRLALDLLLTYGLRFGELFFPLDAFEPSGPRLVWLTGRKKDVPHTLPILEEHARQIAARVSRAREAGLDTIWYDSDRGRDQKGRPAETLTPVSYYGLESRLSGAADRAGIKPGRRIHGARHHAGTTFQREQGDPVLTQKLLGHRDLKSTLRYVHAVEDDVRTALEARHSRNNPEPPPTRRLKA